MERSSALANLATTLLFCLAICSCAISISSAQASTNTEFIRTSCSKTTYPRLCYTSLSSHATLVQTSPKLLAGAALNVTLDKARSTSTMMVRLSRAQGMKSREVGAMRDCVEELSSSVDELRRSIGEMGEIKGSSNFGLIMNDVQTWVSAALTDENTCSDGFSGSMMNGNMKTVVRNEILTIAHLTSNALALINRYASLHG
ncbi:21 kDa protein-like [Rhodamnia argentea]|uniref:21 kDa protein-like n=1 Tax=Rhodamnia argentea TaxID=178133 RepID=A0A8B8PTF5_9MYRT|nr:21 kDa protein-like [Rhodamnia argentea]